MNYPIQRDTSEGMRFFRDALVVLSDNEPLSGISLYVSTKKQDHPKMVEPPVMRQRMVLRPSTGAPTRTLGYHYSLHYRLERGDDKKHLPDSHHIGDYNTNADLADFQTAVKEVSLASMAFLKRTLDETSIDVSIALMLLPETGQEPKELEITEATPELTELLAMPEEELKAKIAYLSVE